MLEQILTGSEAFVQFTEDALVMAVYIVEYGPLVATIFLCFAFLALFLIVNTSLNVSRLRSEVKELKEQLRKGAKNGEDAQ